MSTSLRTRIALALSPERGVKRLVADLQASMLKEVQASTGMAGVQPQRSETRWRGASNSLRSLLGWLPSLGSGRSDTPKYERDRIAGRAYDAYRNQLIARAVVTRVRTNVVGTGLILHPAVDGAVLGLTEEQADELNATIASEASLYFDNPLECDWEKTLDSSGQQVLALVTAVLGGDCFALTPFKERPGCIYGTKIQLVDPARVSNPNDGPNTVTLHDGVAITPDGEPEAIYVRSRHPADTTFGTPDTWVRREIFGRDSGLRRVFQIWNDKDRIGTTRGVSMLAPILEPLHTLEQYSRAELIAAVISSMFTVFIKKEVARFDDRGEPLPPIAGQTVANDPSTLALGSGAVVDLAPGEEAQFANPTRPNANYDPFFLSIVRQIGAALEIPVDELLLQYQSSYSAARAAMLQAWRFYSMRRWWLVQQFCQPWYQLWFDEAVARGRIAVKDYADPRRRAAYTKAVWVGPARGAMDETQEANAARSRIDGGLSNEAIEIAQMIGEPRSVVYAQRKREIEQRRKDGMLLGPAPGAAAANAGGGSSPAGAPAAPGDDPTRQTEPPARRGQQVPPPDPADDDDPPEPPEDEE